MFEQFPYTNLHELNLDWILQKLKEAYSPDNPPDNMVLSVNGETGDVILYQDAVIRFPDIEDATWNIHRIANHSSSGIQFLPEKAQRIDGTDRHDIYDAGNPPPYPVTSVNGETGAVTIPDVVTDLAAEILNIDTASEENYWGIVREVSNGTASIYLDTSNNTIKAYISYISDDDQTNVTLPLLTSADIPSSSGVVSINGKTGAVTLYGSEIYTDSNSQTTIAQDLSANANAISANANAITAETTRAGNAESTLTTNLNAEISRAGAEEAKLQNAIAIIVDGDEAGQAVPVGGYAYIKNNTHGLTDGLYINSGSAAFPVTGGTADSTTFTAVSGGGLNSLNSNIENLSESGDWTPSIPRATFTIASAKYQRIGNFVHLHAALNITDSQSSNAFIDSGSIPKFGKEWSYATGSWMDNSNEKSGQLVSSSNLTIWFSYQGASHPLTDQVGHMVIMSIFYSLS